VAATAPASARERSCERISRKSEGAERGKKTRRESGAGGADDGGRKRGKEERWEEEL
jgi:hypothetical protein